MTDRSHPSSRESRESDSIALDTLFGILADRRRRCYVTALVDHDPRSVEALLYSPDRVSPRKERVALSHTHLPRLQDAGVVEWNRTTEMVRCRPHFDDVEAVVDLLRSNQEVLPGGWP